MSILYNPEKAGRGVSKEQREMKPLFKFFEIFGRKFWYLMQLNFLYIAMCLPIVTIGGATVALAVVMRKFALEQPIFVFSEFFGAFRKNFVRGIFMGILSVGFIAAFVASMFYYGSLVSLDPGIRSYFLLAMNMIAGVVFLTVNIYVYLQMACLDLPLRAIWKNAALLCIAGFKRNMATLAGFVFMLTAMVFLLPYSLIALPFLPFAQLAFLSVFNAYAVVQKYIVAPYYEAKGEKNPDIPDYSGDDEDGDGKSAAIFSDMGGKETPINKKSVKTSGKVIK